MKRKGKNWGFDGQTSMSRGSEKERGNVYPVMHRGVGGRKGHRGDLELCEGGES